MQTGFTFICTTTIRYDRNIMMLHKTKKIEIASLLQRRFDSLVVMRTPHPAHPSTEEVLGYRWLLGFVQIEPMLTA